VDTAATDGQAGPYDAAVRRNLIGITGHQNLPPGAVHTIEERITAVLRPHRGTGLVGITALAAGADQLFARCVLDLGGALEVIVPCDGYEDCFAGDTERRGYESMLAVATTVRRLPHPTPTEEAFMAAGAAVVERCEVLVAVWDGLPARGHGGTADVVSYAHDLGREVVVVWPEGLSRA
jgi:hypothetical protein